MIIAFTLLHLLQYMYLPTHEVWYHGAVWSNVFVLAPLAVLGGIGYWVHKWITSDIKKFDAEKAHDEHTKHLRTILNALDPEVESDTVLDTIADRVDETTPGGIGTLRAEIKAALERESKRP